MYLHTPGAYPKDDGDYAVRVNPAVTGPYANIDLDEEGHLRLALHGLDDCDRLIRAAVAAKRMLEACMSGVPHEFGGPGGYCGRCGVRRGHAIHEAPAACALPGCGHARDSHWEHGEPQGDRAGCSLAGCKCQGYADPAEAADPGYLEDAAAQDDDPDVSGGGVPYPPASTGMQQPAPVVRAIAKDEDGGCLMPSPTGATECMRTAGHDVILGTPHRNANGNEWDDNGWLPAAPGTQAVR